MELSPIRKRARQLLGQFRGIYLLFVIPVLAQFIPAGQASFEQRIIQSNANYENWQQTLQLTVSSSLFPAVVSFILAIFTVSANLSLLPIIREIKTEVGFRDSFQAFQADKMGPVFLTLLLKKILLFLWSLLSNLGGIVTLYASVKILQIAQAYPNTEALLASTEASQSFSQNAGLMGLGLLLALLGLLIYLPQYYAYSQVEFLICDQLENGAYQGPAQVIRQSRKLMKGYKGKRFVLDLTFIGWHILNIITLRLASIYTYPYTQTSFALFYEEIQKKQVENSYEM